MSSCGLKTVRRRLYEIFGTRAADITRADVREARDLMEDAAVASELAMPYARRIAKELGLNPETAVVKGPIKKLDRIFEKAIGKLNGQLEQVPDVGRLRILIEGPEQVLALRRMFLDQRRSFTVMHPTNEVTVNEFEDFFWAPSKTGRVAIHLGLDVNLSGSRRVPFEIQIIHRDMQETEQFTHDNYQKSCEIERKAKHENREPTENETSSMNAYRESNKQRYLADALRLNLYDLRMPSMRVNKGEHLQLIAA